MGVSQKVEVDSAWKHVPDRDEVNVASLEELPQHNEPWRKSPESRSGRRLSTSSRNAFVRSWTGRGSGNIDER